MTASGHRYAVVLLLAPLVLLSGCRSESKPLPTVHYAVAYVSAAAYDGPTASKALRVCSDLPGITETGEAQSLPPVPQLTFAGTRAQQRAVERCLSGLPNTRVYGPSADGQAHAPVLGRNWSDFSKCARPRKVGERLFTDGSTPGASPTPTPC